MECKADRARQNRLTAINWDAMWSFRQWLLGTPVTRLLLCCLLILNPALAEGNALGSVAVSSVTKPPTTAEVMTLARDADWRRPRPDDLLLMQLESGQVIIELAPIFAPEHVANIVTLVGNGWFDGLSINRVQDNFVVQWGDPENTKSLAPAATTVAAEFARNDSKNLAWNFLPDGDVFAEQVGWINGFAAALDSVSGAAWLTHCYGVIGVGRDTAPDSGNGAELYAVIGHAPRQLDRNITVVGRVLQGMELLSSLPRGTGPLGFYEQPEERVKIVSIRQVSRLPLAEQPQIAVLDTGRPIFDLFVESRRNRRDDWYLRPAGHIDLCSVTVPVRRDDRQ